MFEQLEMRKQDFYVKKKAAQWNDDPVHPSPFSSKPKRWWQRLEVNVESTHGARGCGEGTQDEGEKTYREELGARERYQ